MNVPSHFRSSSLSALLLLSLLAGCGDSDNNDSADNPRSSRDGGSQRDAGEDEDDAAAVKDAGGSKDAGNQADGGSAGDGGRSEAGNAEDSGLVDGGRQTDAGDAGVNPAASGTPVNLRTAGSFAILAKSGISTVPPSAITGDIGVSPAAESYITDFSLSADATNVFSTSTQVTGKVYAADQASPTPSNLTTAVSDMELAFTDAAGRAPDFTELGAGNIGGMTLTPGVYKWGTGLLIPTNVTLSGSATSVWIFQVAQDLTVSSAVRVGLSGGALAKNVFWQVAGGATLDTTAHLEGVLISQTSITLKTGATVNGRLLAQTAVTLAGSTVVAPAP